jgi:hypothetical protein
MDIIIQIIAGNVMKKKRKKKMNNECPIDKYKFCKCDILPKGEYYIGDPCYSIGTTEDDYWSDLCKVMFNEQKQNSAAKWNKDKKGKKKLENYGLMVSNPKKKDKKFYDVAIYGTAYGDGTYEDVESLTGDYMVDAGIIGAIPVQAIPKNKKTRATPLDGRIWFVAGGHFVKFDEEVHCFTDGRYLHFGHKGNHIAIDTDPGNLEDQELAYRAVEDNRPW